MRYLFTLACLLLVTATVADEPEFDFSSVGAKKALRDYNKAVAKDEKVQSQQVKEVEAEGAKAAKRTRDAFVENLRKALKKSMQAGNLDEANKINAAIKKLAMPNQGDQGRAKFMGSRSTDILIGKWRVKNSHGFDGMFEFYPDGRVNDNSRWELKDTRIIIRHPTGHWDSFDYPLNQKIVSGDGHAGPDSIRAKKIEQE
jgi:hypothetical protein